MIGPWETLIGIALAVIALAFASPKIFDVWTKFKKVSARTEAIERGTKEIVNTYVRELTEKVKKGELSPEEAIKKLEGFIKEEE